MRYVGPINHVGNESSNEAQHAIVLRKRFSPKFTYGMLTGNKIICMVYGHEEHDKTAQSI
jgi:hypothetical protein